MDKKLVKLNDRLYCLPFDSDTDRPNLYYIQGDRFSVAIDAGNSKKHVELFYSQLQERNLPLPDLTIITHWHWDHTFGLKTIHGLSLSTKKTYDQLEEVKKWVWTKQAMKQREETGEDIAFCNEHIVVEYPDLNEIEVVNTDITIENPVRIDLGGIAIDVIPQISTHCEDSLFVYCKKLDAMFVGDADSSDFYHGEVYDREKLIQLIDFYQSYDYHRHFFFHLEENSKTDAVSALEEELKNLKTDKSL